MTPQYAYFRVELTGFWVPTGDTFEMDEAAWSAPGIGSADGYVGIPEVKAVMSDYWNAEVVIPLNDSRTASLELSIWDQAAQSVKAYESMLRIYYCTPLGVHLVFWGPILSAAWDSSTERVRIDAMDQSARLKNHYLRLGDQAITRDAAHDADGNSNPWDARVPVNYQGIRMIRDCGNNIAIQNEAGDPVLGIANGTNTDADITPPDDGLSVPFKRGDECWDSMIQIANHEAGCDFELAPTDSVEGAYATLRTFERTGTVPDPVAFFQDGFGLDNAQVNFTEQGPFYTHAHVLSSDGKDRITVANGASAVQFGIYVHWDATNYAAGNENILRERGKQLIRSYGHPGHYFEVTPREDTEFYYQDHFVLRSIVRAEARKGYYSAEQEGYVREVRLQQKETGVVVAAMSATLALGGDAEDGEDA